MIHNIKKKLLYYYRLANKPKRIALNGVYIDLNNNYISKNILKFLYFGSYEGSEIRILDKVLQEKDRLMEIGTGIGFLSIYCCKKIGEQNVFTYEANPKLIPIIEKNFKINNVSPELHNCLLTNNKKENELFYCHDSFWSSSTIKRNPECEEIIVPTLSIDTEIKRIGPNFIIMDIEGGERDLINKINLKNINKILIEIHPHIIGNKECSDIILYLISNKFIYNFNISEGDVLFFSKESG